ncbi:MAG: MCE family protein [Myxococcales bacterium]|nr:MAG: MCE family protein [Myxococcales bacterium]
MPRVATPLRVGLVLVIGIAAFAYYVFETSDTPITGGQGYVVSAVFDNAMGLVRKSRVLIAGIPVGEIKDITLDGGRARVFVRVHPSIALYENAAIRKVQESVLGTSLLEIYPGTSDHPALGDGGEIKNVLTSPGINDMMVRMGKISEDLQAITRSLREIMQSSDPDRGSIKALVDNLTRITGAIDGTVGQNTAHIQRILEQTEILSYQLVGTAAESRAEIRAILAEIKDVAVALKSVVDREGTKADQAMDSVNALLQRLDGSLVKLDQAMTHAQSVARKVDEGEGAAGTLINDKQVAEDIKSISSTAAKTVRKLDELQTWFHVQSDFYVNQLSAKTAVSLKLMPRKDKYYMISLIDDPRGRTRRYRTYVKTSDSSRDSFIREDRTVTSYAFKASLLYAQRFSFATLRFGMIENSGGFGLDLEFFDDILKFKQDVYEFSSGEPLPRVKSQVNVEIWKYFFLAGGVDDAINDSTRDYFFGAGIQFNDEDLKTLFTAGAAGAAAGAVSK